MSRAQPGDMVMIESSHSEMQRSLFNYISSRLWRNIYISPHEILQELIVNG